MAHYGPAKWETIKELQQLFSERPIWSQLAIQERLHTSKGSTENDILAKLAYIFRSGIVLSSGQGHLGDSETSMVLHPFMLHADNLRRYLCHR